MLQRLRQEAQVQLGMDADLYLLSGGRRDDGGHLLPRPALRWRGVPRLHGGERLLQLAISLVAQRGLPDEPGGQQPDPPTAGWCLRQGVYRSERHRPAKELPSNSPLGAAPLRTQVRHQGYVGSRRCPEP